MWSKNSDKLVFKYQSHKRVKEAGNSGKKILIKFS